MDGTNSPVIPHQMPNVIKAILITAGTNTAATLSARAWMGALLPWASWTSRIIWERTVSFPTWVALNIKRPSPLMVPPVTRSFSALSTGIGSPLSMDSSTAEAPSIIMPSTGIRSPGLITTTSPDWTMEMEISFSIPFSIILAVPGCSPMSFFMAPPVFPLVLASRSFPNLIRVMMTAEVSKYTCPPSPGSTRIASE